jgi:hypothetical protein
VRELVWYRYRSNTDRIRLDVYRIEPGDDGRYVVDDADAGAFLDLSQAEAEVLVATWPHEYAWLDGGDE